MAQAHPILEKSGFNPDKKLKIVGTSPAKHDGFDKVTGRAKFGADMFLPGMLVGKILRSAAPARDHQVDRHLGGREAAGREGGDHAATTSRRSRPAPPTAT